MKEHSKSFLDLVQDALNTVPEIDIHQVKNKLDTGEDFSLVDCCIAPLLWRLPLVEIEIPKDTKNRSIHEYMKRVFTRPCFLESLSEFEKDIRSI